MPVEIERIESGDNVVLWFDGAKRPEAVVVTMVVEGSDAVTLHTNRERTPSKISIKRGHTVDLVC